MSEERKDGAEAPATVELDEYGWPVEDIVPEYDPSDAVLDTRLATHLPVDADAPERRRPATLMGDLMAGALKRLLPPEADWLQNATDHWAEWVGAEVAACSRPGKLANGMFLVYVKGSVRLAELKRHQMQAIDSRVRQRAGKLVRTIRLVVDPGD